MTPTQAPDPEAAQAAVEYCYAQGWSDGLPLVPASQPLVAEFLATTSRAPDEVIGELEQVGRDCADLRRAGKNGLRGIARFADPDESADATFTRILPSPRHVPLVVAGARNAAISMVVRVFGEWSGTATPVEQVPAAPVEVRS